MPMRLKNMLQRQKTNASEADKAKQDVDQVEKEAACKIEDTPMMEEIKCPGTSKQEENASCVAKEDVKMEEDSEPLSNEHTWRKWKVEIVEKVKAAKNMKKGPMRDLLDTLLAINKTLSENPGNDLLVAGDELFNVVFKITYYDDPDHSICNIPLPGLETASMLPESHE